ncbi:hypothetical protein HMPREF1584_00156 [Gardnerella vaginalis JCP8481A]|nr:hypothetical protein HMPREF1585_01228 [Gardnerella vaginalis JCP8481B]EPI44784.1 hypothetical protein HMPREF1584_00156 [Gardnerella vaginalis JCP8481A]
MIVLRFIVALPYFMLFAVVKDTSKLLSLALFVRNNTTWLFV